MKVLNSKNITPFVTLDNSIIREILAESNSNLRNLSLAEATVPPRQETFAHFHKKSQEIYFILRGKGLIQVGTQNRLLKHGDAVFIPARQRHRIKNTGNVNLVFLCICSPAYKHKDTVIMHRTKQKSNAVKCQD